MGERGPVPIPHARRRNKRLSSGKTIPVEAPEMPDDMDGEAAAEGERIVPDIEAMGLIATPDRGVLIRYCRGRAGGVGPGLDVAISARFGARHGGAHPVYYYCICGI